jgi:GNAT superfamily N-acetyltransferase
MSLTMRRATAADRPDVLRLLNDRARWLRDRGLPQWGGGFPADRIGRLVARGGTFLAVRHDGTAVGTITLSPDGDPDFWTQSELLEPAWYVTKMATSLEHGKGLGAPMLRWAVDQAAQEGMTWVRLDVWRTNTGLRDWYAAQGWEHVRTVEAPGRNSGALFRHPAVADVEARRFFGRSPVMQRLMRPPLEPGTEVDVLPARERGLIEAVHLADAGMPESGDAPEYPMRSYTVRMTDGSLRTCGDAALDLAS